MLDVKSKIRISQPNSPPPAEQTQQAIELLETYGAVWLENVFAKSTIQDLLAAHQKKYLTLSKKELFAQEQGSVHRVSVPERLRNGSLRQIATTNSEKRPSCFSKCLTISSSVHSS